MQVVKVLAAGAEAAVVDGWVDGLCFSPAARPIKRQSLFYHKQRRRRRKKTNIFSERERERETISTYIEGKEKEKQHSSTGATVSLCKQRAIAAVNLARALSTGLIYFLYRTTTAAAAGGTATGRYVYILLIIVML